MPSKLEVWASPEPTVARIAATRTIDQLRATGHDRRIGDAERIAATGASASRAPVLWEHAAPVDPSVVELTTAARRLHALRAAGVEPIVTLLHHGSGPRYTDLLDPAFPALFADYAETVARAFPWVRRWTPINEPLTTARFATLYGVWFPNRRDDRAFGRAMLHQTRAQQDAMARIRAIVPDAQFVPTDDLQGFTAGDDGQTAYTTFLRERVTLAIELVAGRVDAQHPLYGWLTGACGMLARELEALRAAAVVPDLVAFNHYPHSERYLFTCDDGAVGDVPAVYVRGCAPPRAGPLLRAAAQRLQLPVALGEVHVHAPERERVRWLAEHVEDVLALRAAGIDVRAVGAWAAFGMQDWHSLMQRDDGVVEDGIYTFAGTDGEPQPTAVVSALRELTATGTLGDRGDAGWWTREDRFLALDEQLAERRRGIPEGDHVIRARVA